MRKLFRLTIIKSWIWTNFEKSEDRKCNKKIVKESFSFHNECWIDRCKSMHNEEDKKKRPTQWYQSDFDETMSGHSEERRHAKRTKLDFNCAQNENIRSWILGSLKMKWKLSNHPQAYITRFFNV